jgi:ubiquinone/menaquinone biosynthesis C-methylase UbiE
MIGHLLLEKLSLRVLPRVPETDSVMEEQGQIIAFMEGGLNEGILAHIYLFHALICLPIIRPGDTVVDLACGPANQLVQMAKLNPQANFIGVDASPGMIALAQKTLNSHGLGNIALQTGDMTQLSVFADESVDCVTCTMSLHHLPDVSALTATLGEIRRILKPDGGVYLADFGRLKRVSTQRFFAYDRQELQSDQFTADFLASMSAAFSPAEFNAALKTAGLLLERYETALAPFMIIYRSALRRHIDPALAVSARASYTALSNGQQRDFDNFTRWFKAGGLNLPCSIR